MPHGNMIPADEFDELVRQALNDLPEEFLLRMQNVDVVVEDWPTEQQLDEHGLASDETLFGLYEGIALPDRHTYGEVLPDKITIFQGPILDYCDSRAEMIEQIRVTVVHEIAHHFGIDDDALYRMGLD